VYRNLTKSNYLAELIKTYFFQVFSALWWSVFFPGRHQRAYLHSTTLCKLLHWCLRL